MLETVQYTNAERLGNAVKNSDDTTGLGFWWSEGDYCIVGRSILRNSSNRVNTFHGCVGAIQGYVFVTVRVVAFAFMAFSISLASESNLNNIRLFADVDDGRLNLFGYNELS